MIDPRDGFSEEAMRLTAAAREAADEAIQAAFAGGRPVTEAGTGADRDSTYRVWPDGRRERIESAAERARRLHGDRTA